MYRDWLLSVELTAPPKRAGLGQGKGRPRNAHGPAETTRQLLVVVVVAMVASTHGQYDLEKMTTLLPSTSFSTKSTVFIDLSE